MIKRERVDCVLGAACRRIYTSQRMKYSLAWDS